MKKLFFLFLAVAFFGCGGGVKNTPEDVSIAFYKALYSGDMKQANALSTEKTQKTIKDLEVLLNADKENKDKMAKTKFEKATCAEAGTDRMQCKVCCDSDGKDATAYVSKVDGKWKVDMTKSEMSGKSDALQGLENLNDNAFDSLDTQLDSLSKELDKIGK